MEVNPEELKKWGFTPSLSIANTWYNNCLCMNIKVVQQLTDGNLTRSDFIHAVYEHGRKNGILEAQEKIKQAMGV